MGCRAHLFTSDSETPDYTLQEPGIALGAKYLVPAFWSLMFSSNAYRYVMEIDQYEPDPEVTPTHFFIEETEKAIELFHQRESRLFEVIPPDWKLLSAQFVEFLKARSLRYVHMNIGELATMVDEEAFVEQFKLTLDSLNRPPFVNPVGLFAKYRKPHLHEGWEDMLEYASINYKKPGKIEYWHLAGAGEGEDAPWDEPD